MRHIEMRKIRVDGIMSFTDIRYPKIRIEISEKQKLIIIRDRNI